jgi:uncharacterized protein YbaA (DUF1428 family)
MAKMAGKVWRDHGALEYVECIADDVKPGKHTSFPQSVELKPGEIVIFAYIVYKSRAQRDRVNAKVMKDPIWRNRWTPKPCRSMLSACLGWFQACDCALRRSLLCKEK